MSWNELLTDKARLDLEPNMKAMNELDAFIDYMYM